MTISTDPLEAPDFDPDAFMDRLRYATPGPDVDLPEPPVLTSADQVVVRRTYDLPADVDARLRALAAARGISVEQLVSDWAQHAA